MCSIGGSNAWSLSIEYNKVSAQSGSSSSSSSGGLVSNASSSGVVNVISDTDGAGENTFNYVKDKTVFPPSVIEVSTSDAWEFTAVLSDMFHTVRQKFMVLKVGGYFDIEKFGVAVGMRSKGHLADLEADINDVDDKRFEVAEDYTSMFYGPVRMVTEDISSLYTLTVTGGNARFHNISAVRCGNIVNIVITLVLTSSTNAGSNICTGTLSGGPLPAVDVLNLASYSVSSGGALFLRTDGTMTLRAIGASFGTANQTCTVCIGFITGN